MFDMEVVFAFPAFLVRLIRRRYRLHNKVVRVVV